MHTGRPVTAARWALAALLVCLLINGVAGAQSLSVLPVNIFMTPGQSAASLTVNNRGTGSTAVQIRAFDWNQKDGDDQLVPTNEVVVSPPIASIAPGGAQVIRIILRQPPQNKEATYRILIDQIPPAAEPGIVHVVLRLSIPIFAAPNKRVSPHIKFLLTRDSEHLYLIGNNDGLRHESIRDIVLTTPDGHQFKAGVGASPYILAGSARRWAITPQDPLPQHGEILRLTAHTDSGNIEEQVSVTSIP